MILGQKQAKQRLQRMLQNERLAHAMLFLGPEGSGKLAMALAFAQTVLCENKQMDASGEIVACGTCKACVKTAKWIHPDVHFSFPTIGTNARSDQFLEHWRAMLNNHTYPTVYEWLQRIGAENKQGNINKEECLNIVRKLSLKTFEGSHKILILWMPEYLGKEGNRLLKLIEEPPAQTIFILVAENQELILNTILSRCQIVQFQTLQDEEIVAGLKQRGHEEVAAFSAAQLANGNFNEAMKLAVTSENDNATLFLEWMRKCYKGHGVELVKWVEQFAGVGRENQKFFLRYALHFMREYTLLFATQDVTRLRLREAEKQTAQKFLNIIGFEQIERIVSLINQLSYHVERNANPKVLFLDASLQMHNFLRGVSVLEK